jgi:hypothetical protein
MNEIICTHCKKAFTVDESGYADIVRQVRNSEFKQELDVHRKAADEDKDKAIKIAKSEVGSQMQKDITAKDLEIQRLNASIEASDAANELAMEKALIASVKERDVFENKFNQTQQALLEAGKVAEANKESASAKHELEVSKAVNAVEKSRDEMKNSYEVQLFGLKEENGHLKDHKARQSTKMVGETLEIHCETVFNTIRPTAFPLAKFDKDNDSSGGNKGDYIFRDMDNTGTEIISIMFEMKNEV